MCARFELNQQPGDLATRFGLEDSPPAINMPVIRPTDHTLIIKPGGKAVLCGWGFDVSWDNKPLINARAESLSEKKTFAPLLEQRCLVPATGYFEWRKLEGVKYKNTIYPSDKAVFSMAGLIDGDRFTIITCPPSPEIAHIHNRMPVILTPQGEASWLNPAETFTSVRHHLVPYDQAPMIAVEETPPPPRQADLFS